jgi:gas vesicle protein
MRHDAYDDEPTVIIEKHSGSVGSFLVGLAFGAGLALLLAPQPGVETRRVIARDLAFDAADDVTTRVTDEFGRARVAVTTRVDRARQAVDLKRQQVQRAIDAGRTAATEARDDLERRIAETKAAYQAGARVAREELDRPLATGRSAPGIAGASGADSGDADGDEL